MMNLFELQRKLLEAARSNPPSEQVPYAFEKRIMAGITALPKTDEWAWWSRALWRGAAACAGVAILLGAWSFLPGSSPASSGPDLEEAVLASLNEAEVTW